MAWHLPSQIILADFEFSSPPGERPRPVCMVAEEIRSGRQWRLWADEFGPTPPFSTGPDTLFVAYFTSAELSCFKVLGWPIEDRPDVVAKGIPAEGEQESKEVDDSIEQLELQLEAAVAAADFEKALRIRDQRNARKAERANLVHRWLDFYKH